MMCEPTETEARETLDAFADAMLAIDAEIESDPDALHDAPRTAPIRRPDEARAARDLRARWYPPEDHTPHPSAPSLAGPEDKPSA
jgi:glycine dehydrogenase subunit 2